jgi:hypothetical protein
LHTVASTTATKDNPNIRLLDVSQAVKKSGADIAGDAFKNTTLIEVSTGLDTKTALVAAVFAKTGRPSDPQEQVIYDRLDQILKSIDSSYDNVIGVTKVTVSEEGDPQIIDNYASTDDKLYTTTAMADINLFFDVGVNGSKAYTTENSGFYLLNTADKTVFTNIAKGNELNGGFIYMDSFLGYDKENMSGYEIVAPTSPEEDPAFYGNGRIEHILCDNSEFAYTESLAEIASDVATWLAESTYTSAFDVFASEDQASKDALAQIYSTAQ